MYYVVNKVIISPKVDNYEVTVDNIFNSLLDVERYINNMTYIDVDSKTRILHPIETPIGTEIPTEDDPDGYYIVKNTQKENRYDIYEKQTKLDKGYIYNSINQTIKQIMFYEINCFEENLFTRKYILRPTNTTDDKSKYNSNLVNHTTENLNKNNEIETNEIETLDNKSLSYKITPTEINQIFVVELKQKIKEIQEQKNKESKERKNK